jgi:hypothetical protein
MPGMKMCSCRACRRGRGGGRDWKIMYRRRAQRSRVREALRQCFVGSAESIDPHTPAPPKQWSAGYTD